MKLEKENDIFENNSWFNYIIVLNLIVIIVGAVIVFIQGLHKILPFIILVVVGMIIILYLCNPKKQKNKKYTKVKDIEHKIEGNIISTGYEIMYSGIDNSISYKRSRGRRELYYILVSYDDKIMKVRDLKNNIAYKILCLLLDPYPIKKERYIPIDIYINKKNVYVDLESVDLSKIEGFAEAKKIVEEMQNIN